MKSKSVIVLEALLQGQEVTIDNKIYLFDNNKLCIKARNEINPNLINVLYADISLSNFIKECEKLSFDKSFIISSNTALTKIKRGKK